MASYFAYTLGRSPRSGCAASFGRPVKFEQLALPSATLMRQEDFTWTADSAGRPSVASFRGSAIAGGYRGWHGGHAVPRGAHTRRLRSPPFASERQSERFAEAGAGNVNALRRAWAAMRYSLSMKLLLLLGVAVSLHAQTYDLVIRGGRVLDPESALDAVRDVGVNGGRIAAVSAAPLRGRQVVEAKGLVVAPGFIDLHAHGQDEENQRLQAQDGVTTALELEIGAADVEGWYREREGKRYIHSGVTVGHVGLRMRLMNDPSGSLVPSGAAKDREASEEDITTLKAGVERGLRQGALGVGFGVQYTPGATRWEILEVFRVAGRFQAPVFTHIRTMGGGDRDAMIGLQEVLANAAATGVGLHVVHATSSGLRNAGKLIQTVMEARARGVDISTECYPYTAAMTDIASAIFDDGWQKVLGISYPGVQWVATGERLTEASFARYRGQGGMVIMHMIPEEIARMAVAHRDVIIASDGHIAGGKGHPRGAGTFARVLGRYVREQKALTLAEAVRKMTLLPASRLEKYVPAMKAKGRIKAGGDADLVVFDAETIMDRATFENPAVASTGVRFLVVDGRVLIQDGALQESLRPGRAVRAKVE